MQMSSPLPNLVISGVVKGGTTSIFTYLSRHPNICSSSVKETCYFLTCRYGQLDARYKNSSDPFAQYQQYFSHHQNEKYIMEATPGYFEGGKKLANELKQVLGQDIKILIVLREPVSRLLSFFKYKKSMLQVDPQMTLEDYISQCESLPLEERKKVENDTFWGLDGGYYSNYLNEWFEVFGDSIKIVFFDQLKNDSKLLLKELCSWLDIDESLYDAIALEVENKTVAYKSKCLQASALFLNQKAEKFWRANPQVKSTLRDFYYRFNGSKDKNSFNEETINFLHSMYEPYNQLLAHQLTERGYSNLPEWLQGMP